MTTATATRAPERESPPAGGNSSLAGTGTLIRFILRRDRIKLPAWLLGITALLAYYGALLPTVFETDEEMQALGPYLEGPVGALLSGPGYGSEFLTMERLIVSVYGAYFLILAALMSMLLVSRHTRVDEQQGRTELIRATVVGRHAQLTAVMIVAVGANVLLALLLSGAMAANGFDAGEGVLFGAGVGAVGLLFAAVTALTVQVTEYSRAATGLAAAVLGASWVVRSAGDLLAHHGSTLSWFSPLAWSQQTRAYVDGRWWPLLLTLAASAAILAVGYVLSVRRDVGAGLVAARRGDAHAASWLRSPLTFAYRIQRASLFGWTAALAAAGLLFGWITEPMIEAYEDMGDDMVAILGGDEANLINGYISTMAMFMAIIVGIFVILAVQTLRFEETRGRAEPLLATAIGRVSYLGSYLAVTAIAAVGLLFVVGLGTGVGAAVGFNDAAYLWDVTLAHLAYAPAVLLLMAIAALLFGVVPQGIGATWAVLGYMLVVGFFGPLMDLPQGAHNISPMEHIARLPLEEVRWAPLVILSAITVVLAAAGLAAFRRRDLDTK